MDTHETETDPTTAPSLEVSDEQLDAIDAELAERETLGESSPEEEPPLQVLLAEADAHIPQEAIDAWTDEQRADAKAWATYQLESNRRAKPGFRAWTVRPKHVIEAVEASRQQPLDADADAVSPEPQVSSPEPGAAPQTSGIVNENETRVKCPHCGVAGGWLGELDIATSQTFTRGLGPNGAPNCPACGFEMEVLPFLVAPSTPPENPVTVAARMLDAEKAGQAARPMYQPSLPGTRPPFDWKRAQMTTESLERNVATCEDLYDEAKKEAAERKKEFDEAVETLRKHIQQTSKDRQEWEFQQGRGAGLPTPEAAPAATPTAAAVRRACITEQTYGRPCPICRAPDSPDEVGDEDTLQHLADAVSAHCEAGTLTTEILRDAIESLAGIVVSLGDVERIAADSWSMVVDWLHVFATEEKPWIHARPGGIDKWHEAAEPVNGTQSCRICGNELMQIAEGATPYSVGQRIGLGVCSGEPSAEPARTTSRRHKTPKDAAKAKQRAKKDAAAPTPEVDDNVGNQVPPADASDDMLDTHDA